MKKRMINAVAILIVMTLLGTNVLAYGAEENVVNSETIGGSDICDLCNFDDDDMNQNIESEVNANFADESDINALNISFDENKNITWTRSNASVMTYYKFEVKENGIVKFSGKKPVDSDGDIGRVDLSIYDANKKLVFNTDEYYSSQETWGDYAYSIGLRPGVYYLAIKPYFSLIKGNITFDFKLQFEKMAFCELEPNETASTATPMGLNTLYKGYFGNDGGDNAEESDYYAVDLQSDKKYYFFAPKCEEYINTTTIIEITSNFGSLSYSLQNKPLMDKNGNQYVEFTVDKTGTHYLRVYNYHQKQFEYNIGIYTKSTCSSEEPLTPITPTNPSNEDTSGEEKPNVAVDDLYYEMFIGDSVKCNVGTNDGFVKYKSEKNSIATVSSDGTIIANKEGSTTIIATTLGKTYYIDVDVIKPVVCGHSSVMIGETVQLTVKNNNAPVLWKSSNAGVATVDSKGVVQGIKKGKVTVTAMIQGKKYTKKITVRN